MNFSFKLAIFSNLVYHATVKENARFLAEPVNEIGRFMGFVRCKEELL